MANFIEVAVWSPQQDGRNPQPENAMTSMTLIAVTAESIPSWARGIRRLLSHTELKAMHPTFLYALAEHNSPCSDLPTSG